MSRLNEKVFRFTEDSDPIKGLGIEHPIKKWLDDCDKRNEIRGPTLTVIIGDIDLTNGKFKKPKDKLPEFEVEGNFWIDGNNLGSLKGYCPIKVSGSFSCTNNHLNDLEGLPLRENVKGNMWVI